MDAWDRQLDGFRERIESIDRAHATGVWEEVPPWTPPESDLGPPTPEHLERLQELLVHASMVGVEVARAMRERGREHAASRSRVDVARRYLQSQALV